MKTDSLFYLLFQLTPPLFFDLIGVPDQGQGYRFDAVEVKEVAFRIDGVFLPPERVRFSVPKGIAWRPWACLPWRNWPRPCWTFTSLADLQHWWQLWQEQQGQVLAALVAHLGQPLDSWDPPLVDQVQRLGRQQLTTLQEDLLGLSRLVRAGQAAALGSQTLKSIAASMVRQRCLNASTGWQPIAYWGAWTM